MDNVSSAELIKYGFLIFKSVVALVDIILIVIKNVLPVLIIKLGILIF